MGNGETLLKRALKLKPQNRFLLIDGLIRSLDEPDKKIDYEVGIEEVGRCLKAPIEGKTQGVPFKSVFDEEFH